MTLANDFCLQSLSTRSQSKAIHWPVSTSFSQSLLHSCTHALTHSLIYSVLSANTRSAAIENDSIKLPSAGQLQMQIQIQLEIRIEIQIEIQILPGLQLPAAIMHSATCCCLPHATTATIQSNFRIFHFPLFFACFLRISLANVACVCCMQPLPLLIPHLPGTHSKCAH